MILKNFFTLEGIEATGKSTIAKLLQEKLTKDGIITHVTREPGGTPIGEEIRSIIMKNDELDPVTEFMLFSAARREHLARTIIPLLKQGDIVISDRYLHSGIAYGYASGLDVEECWRLSSEAITEYMPTTIFYIDVDVKTSLARKKYVENQNRLDTESEHFYVLVKSAYNQMFSDFKYGNFVKIDGNQSIEEIVEIIYKLIIKEKM